jgi:uncharacterized repeat protein (TIGR03803 family)
MKRKKNAATLFPLAIAIVLLSASAAWAATEQILSSFKAPPDANNPEARLVLDSAGNLYGTTIGGGTHGFGTVFELLPSSGGGWTESVVYDFTGCADGGQPIASLALDASGNLYGTTFLGGSGCGTDGNGVVFKLSPSGGSWTESVLYTFSGGLDGQHPQGNVVFDNAGNLIGTTLVGGSKTFGVIFELTPSQNGPWTETVIHNFLGTVDGSNPVGDVTGDRLGRIYGTTRGGIGTVFRLAKSARTKKWSYKELYSFANGGGQAPYGGLAVDSQFHIFGTTYVGLAGTGNVFELALASGKWQVSQLYPFTGHGDGGNPLAGLVQDAAGNLYGTASIGGDSGVGVVFEMVQSGGAFTYKRLYSFSGTVHGDGASPAADLIIDASGHLLGTTFNGGANGSGCVFEVTLP